MTVSDSVEWRDLLLKYGFKVERSGSGVLLVEEDDFCVCYLAGSGKPQMLTSENPNPAFFKKMLFVLGLSESYDEQTRVFDPPSPSFSEGAFLDAYYRCQQNAETGMPFDLSALEPHMARLIRELNEVELYTCGSCEGHIRDGRFEGAYIGFFDPYVELGREVLKLLNPRICIGSMGRLIFPHREMSPQEQAENLWRELAKTAETIADNKEKTKKLVAAMKRVLDARDEILPLERTGQNRMSRH